MGREAVSASGEGQLTLGRAGARPVLRSALPVVVGTLAAGSLLAFYVLLVGALQGFAHARELVWQDRFFVLPVALGFGAQWGLFVQLWRVRHARSMGSSAAVASSGTGASAVSMVACCLHHVTDVLPVAGFSGAAIFLGQYRTPFMALALTMNLAGVAWMLHLLRRASRQACHAQPAQADAFAVTPHAS